jgi:hypothetical protein
MSGTRKIGFVSYAQSDALLVDRFLELLRPRLATRREMVLELWSDRAILVGEQWLQEIERALEEADFGLLCLSPSFLASRFVRDVEIPSFLNPGRVVIPVALEPLDLARTQLHGVEGRQVFRYTPPGTTRKLSFAECGGVNRQRFCDELVTQVVERLLKDGTGP